MESFHVRNNLPPEYRFVAYILTHMPMVLLRNKQGLHRPALLQGFTETLQEKGQCGYREVNSKKWTVYTKVC